MAFGTAVALGYRYVETDVHVARDGTVVICHDSSLDRTTDRSGRIADLDIEAIEAADAGFHFTLSGGDARFPYRGQGVRIPRLETLLERWPQLRINIDVKTDAVVAPLLHLLARFDAFDRVCLGAFSDHRLARIRRLAKRRVCTSMGPAAVARARITSRFFGMARAGADCIQLPPYRHGIRLIDRRLLSVAHRMDLPVHVWTINDETAMTRLLDLGVDGIMTDRPTMLRDVFMRRGLNLDGSSPT